jgi:hypothetical protein
MKLIEGMPRLLRVSKLKPYLSRKSLLTPAYRTGRSLCQPEVGALSKGGIPPYQRGRQGVVAPSFSPRRIRLSAEEKRGEGRFTQCKSYFETVNNFKKSRIYTIIKNKLIIKNITHTGG